MNIKTIYEARFLSPGTFVSEESTRQLTAPDVQEAARLSAEIEERYGAKPYAFRLAEYEQPEPVDGYEFERKLKRTSCVCHLNATVETLADVEARNDPTEDILRSKMRCNGWTIAMTRNSYKHCVVFGDGDCVVDSEGNVTRGELTWTDAP